MDFFKVFTACEIAYQHNHQNIAQIMFLTSVNSEILDCH